MAHLSTVEIDDIAAATVDFRLPTLVDNVYVGTPLFKLLDAQHRITAQGGANISQPFIYAKGPGGSYRGFDTLDVARRKTKTRLILDWKQYFASVTIDGLTALATAGPEAIFDMVDAEMKQAEMTLIDIMGGDIFLDGTGNFSKAIDGFDVAINTTGTYGGINRVTDVEGAALLGNRDTTGGNVTLPALQSLWGSATHAGAHPDILIADQKIYDQIWMRIQPSQRLPIGPMAEMMAARGPNGQAGFDNIRFNSAMVVVDEKCPTGYLLMLNTEFIELVAHIARANIEVQGPTESVNQDARVWKLLWMGNLVVSSPRMQAVATGLSES
jgi:hypothetical protein